MASLDTTAFAAALKRKYTDRRIQWLAYKNNPFLALVPKSSDFGGESKSIPVRYGTPQGRSVSFTTAQSNKTASSAAAFLITRVSDYAVASITGETIEASEGNSNALMRAVSYEMDGAIYTATRSLAIALWRNGGGARGQISAASNTATATITLANTADIVNFEKGMVLQVSADDGTTGAVRDGTVTVAALNRDTGTITASGNWTAGIGAAAASDYIFQAGDFGGMLKGVAAWVPTTAPTSTAFFGVDRSVDVTRLGGIRVTASGANMEEYLINAIARASREGANTSHVFMNPVDRATLVKGLGSKVQYNRVESDVAGIGFKTVQIEGDKGPVDVVSDPNLPQGKIYGLQMDTWELNTLGPAPKVLNLDGNDMLREYNADSYEIRVGYRGQLACYAPGWNWVLSGF